MPATEAPGQSMAGRERWLPLLLAALSVAWIPAFETETLRTILRTYDVGHILASSEYGAYAARGVVVSDAPELRIVGALETGAVSRTVPQREAP